MSITTFLDSGRQRKKCLMFVKHFFYYVTFSPFRSVRCETNKPPAMRVRIEGYTKKLQTRYNKGVQANCKAKGEKYGSKST